MLTKNQIIETFYQSKNFTDCIKKMEPDYLQDDLKAEVILILLQMDEKKLQQLNEKNQLNFYAARVIMNLIKSKTSPFYKQYRVDNNAVNLFHTMRDKSGNNCDGDFINNKINLAISANNEQSDLKDRQTLELLQDAAMQSIDDLTWYEQGIIKLYVKLGNYRAIEKDTGIPWESCYTTIQKAIKKIRCKLAIPS